MTTLTLLPDAEKLVVNFLLAQTAIAALVSDRVYTVVPGNADADLPLIRVSQFDSIDVTPNVAYVEQAVLQVDAYGGPKATASLIGRTVRAVLFDIPGVHDEGVVNGVRTAGWRYDPDTTFKPARPRFHFTVQLYGHPHPFSGS